MFAQPPLWFIIIAFLCAIGPLVFFHELGHCESHKRLGPDHVYMSTLSMEGMAWEVGFSIAADYGYAWNFYHPVKQWARQQLATYLEGDNAGELTRKYVETSPGVYSRAE